MQVRAMAYSNDIRLKVLAAVDRGGSEASVARRFDFDDRTVLRKQVRHKPGITVRQPRPMLGVNVSIPSLDEP